MGLERCIALPQILELRINIAIDVLTVLLAGVVSPHELRKTVHVPKDLHHGEDRESSSRRTLESTPCVFC